MPIDPTGYIVQTGGPGTDRLAGGRTADWLEGAGGDDTLLGRVGDDVLLVGAGRDILRGGRGNDVRLGGSEGDTFDIDIGDARLADLGNDDTIADLDFSQGDVVRVGGFRTLFNSEGTTALTGSANAFVRYETIASLGDLRALLNLMTALEDASATLSRSLDGADGLCSISGATPAATLPATPAVSAMATATNIWRSSSAPMARRSSSGHPARRAIPSSPT